MQNIDTIINPIYTNGKIKIAKKNDVNTIKFNDVKIGLSKEKNIDLYITGSNSKMLSKNIATEFRDKKKEINLLPLSFKEIFDYKNNEDINKLFNESKRCKTLEYISYNIY